MNTNDEYIIVKYIDGNNHSIPGAIAGELGIPDKPHVPGRAILNSLTDKKSAKGLIVVQDKETKIWYLRSGFTTVGPSWHEKPDSEKARQFIKDDDGDPDELYLHRVKILQMHSSEENIIFDFEKWQGRNAVPGSIERTSKEIVDGGFELLQKKG